MNPIINVSLHEGPLASACEVDAPDGCGAVVVFEGRVRGLEDGRPVAALAYEAYEPMTTRELRSLAESVCAEHQLPWLRAEHSTGRVGVGEVSFRLSIAAPHRAEALAAAGVFIDRMKREVPLWKVPVYA